MREPAHQIHLALTSAEKRKKSVIRACEVDREGWRHAFRPSTSPTQALARDLFGYLESIVSLFPGRVGRWFRSASILTNVGRYLGWL